MFLRSAAKAKYDERPNPLTGNVTLQLKSKLSVENDT